MEDYGTGGRLMKTPDLGSVEVSHRGGCHYPGFVLETQLEMVCVLVSPPGSIEGNVDPMECI